MSDFVYCGLIVSVVSDFTDEFQAVRAFETIAFIVATVGVVLLLIYTCARIVHRHSFALAIMIVLFVTGKFLYLRPNVIIV